MATSNPKQTKPSKPGDHFDYRKLVETFAEICPDFKAEQLRKSPVSKRFAEKVIFECSKEAKLAKTKAKRDTVWKIALEVIDKKRVVGENIVVISTYFFKPPPAQQPFVLHNHLQLTFKQASLLAVDKYCQLLPQLKKEQRGHIALTPLAGAVFAKESISQLVEVFTERSGTPISEDDVLTAIISSCQTDGYHLKPSRCHIAIVALNRTIADLKIRDSLIKKTIKMYRLFGKPFDMELFKIYERHARDYVHVRKETRPELNKQTSIEDEELAELVKQIRIASLDNNDTLNGRNLPVVSDMPDIKTETISCLEVCGVVKANKKSMKCAAKFTESDEQDSSSDSSSDSTSNDELEK